MMDGDNDDDESDEVECVDWWDREADRCRNDSVDIVVTDGLVLVG